MFKKNWDILCGLVAGVLLAIVAGFDLEKVQTVYSVIILMIVCIGIFRIIKQDTEKKMTKRQHNVIDSLVDAQKPIKAVLLAEQPEEQGKQLGLKILFIWGVIKRIMEKLKTFFSKFKGWILTIALMILTVVELCGGFINELCGGVLVWNGIPVIPVVTLVCTTVVGLLSNTYTKEQRQAALAAIKNLTQAKTATEKNKIVVAEIKHTLKEKQAELTKQQKHLATLQHELAELEKKLVNLKDVLQAKREMFGMAPRLATEDDVKQASAAVTECEALVRAKHAEIAEAEATVDSLKTMIAALQSQQ